MSKKISVGKIVFILFILYVVIFLWFRPFDGVITEDRPIMRALCEMQIECNSARGDYTCSFNGRIEDKKLKVWSSYRGCNESTERYNFDGRFGRITIESCNCGGLM